MAPRSFPQWWTWGVDQADALRRDEPLRTTQESFPQGRDPGPSRTGGRLGGRPFTVAFEDYLEDRPVESPFRTAMARLYNPRRVQTHEYRILHALTAGATDAELVRARIGGCRRDFFEAAAVRALSYVRSRIESELPPGRSR